MAPSEEHEQELKNYLKELEFEGYRVFDLERKCPDGIAIKDGKVYAIEILSQRWRKSKGWDKRQSERNKESNYHMFDGILIRNFRHPRYIKLEEENKKF